MTFVTFQVVNLLQFEVFQKVLLSKKNAGGKCMLGVS